LQATSHSALRLLGTLAQFLFALGHCVFRLLDSPYQVFPQHDDALPSLTRRRANQLLRVTNNNFEVGNQFFHRYF
jgi:hypothetical protein